jgi:hypothetical protein
MGSCSAGKEILEEEGALPLIPSSTSVEMFFWLKLCEHRRQSVPSDINDQHGGLGELGQL